MTAAELMEETRALEMSSDNLDYREVLVCGEVEFRKGLKERRYEDNIT